MEAKIEFSPDVLGKSLTLDAENSLSLELFQRLDLEVPGFRERDVYVTIGQWTDSLLLNRGAGLGIHGVGRLKPGVALAQARDMDKLPAIYAAAYPNGDKAIRLTSSHIKQPIVGGEASPI